MRLDRRTFIAAAACGAMLPAAHGSGFSTASSTPGTRLNFTPDQLARFAKKVERTLAAEGAHVALLARMGRPLAEMPPGMQYTHVGFAVYSSITTTDGRKVPGYALFNLYQKDDRPDLSELVQDFPVDFFAGVSVLDAGVIIPTADLQRRLLAIIASPAYAALHDTHYSLIANPFNLGRQNCTEFVLDVIESALDGSSDPKAIKTALGAGFKAQPVQVHPLRLLVGALFSAEVSMSDQDGTPVTATFETIAEYLKQRDPGSRTLHVLPD